MSVGMVLYTLLIKPLELIFEIIYSIANSVIVNPGLSIIALSLAMNFLVLPLYMRADALQMEEQEREKKLKDMTSHIRKTFKGDERFMMLQAYYRENDYKPIYALRGSFSLLLEIPFFISAYHFLSHLELIKGVSFGPIKDLGYQDGLIQAFGVSINLLPILMTLINIVSSLIYSKGSPVKTKVQLCVVALVFLVFLYKSPSGLVFYWTLNNLFSLIKNVFYKLKEPRKILCILSSCFGVLLAGMIVARGVYSLRQKIVLFGFCLMLQLPILISKTQIMSRLENKRNERSKKNGFENANSVFLFSMIYVAILIGLLITSQVIASSTAEFVNILDLYNPSMYVLNSLLIAVGLFVIWIGIFYYLTDKKSRGLFAEACLMFAIIASVDYMFFGTKLGNLSQRLQFDNAPVYSLKQMGLNLLVIVAIIVVVHLIINWNSKVIVPILLAGIIAIGFMSVKNVKIINSEYAKVYDTIDQSSELPVYRFSKNGKNVVILMMDRMIGDYIPYLFHERPDLKEKFDGFTYYSNTVSFGTSTNAGLQGLFGGYEYTPKEMNKRDDTPLVEKNNESLKVMPTLFAENDFDVTVCDPSYANYNYIPDLSIFDDCPGVKAYITKGKLNDSIVKGAGLKDLLNRNLVCYGIFKSIPLVVQSSFYNNGNYFSTGMGNGEEDIEANMQIRSSLAVGEGYDVNFIDAYSTLYNMVPMTRIEDDNSNHYLSMCNETTHRPCILQLPDYVPKYETDNSEYYEGSYIKTDDEGNTINIEDEENYPHYHVHMATLIELGKWFDYLKEEGVYDNTRIIIASDHSWTINLDESMFLEDHDLEHFCCTLMVKDFNAKGFTESKEFMTNADVPTIAMDGLIENPINPYTNNPINSDPKYEGPQELHYVETWQTEINNGNTYLPGFWYSVHDDVHDPKNWKYLGYY